MITVKVESRREQDYSRNFLTNYTKMFPHSFPALSMDSERF